MALQGTIRDFGVGEIFQLIGMQRKTGVLTLESNEDTVTVSFVDGQVAGADTKLRNLEDLLGAVLVRTSRISQDQLQQALRIQKKTLQRLGYILVASDFISDEELSEALRIQVTQIVYRLFRWRAGSYHFQPQEDVEYDKEHFDPVSAETILMEGARMIDEWPIIERKIKSDKMVFKKTEAGRTADVPVESIVDKDVDFGFDGREAGSDSQSEEAEIRVSTDEREILRMVDGRTNVGELVDRSTLGEFDTYRVLYELLTRNLIVEVKALPVMGPAKRPERTTRFVGVLLPLVLGLFSILSLLTLGANPLTPWHLGSGADDRATDRLRAYASRVRLERIEHAIRVFYLDTGTVPDRLELLAGSGYLVEDDLVDPWGRPYGYRFDGGSFRLAGSDSEGDPDDQLTIVRRLSASQRLLLDGAPREP
jgi:hypothetical protein